MSGYLKCKINVRRPENIEDLKMMIREEIPLIQPATVNKFVDKLLFRIEYYLQVNDRQFEYLIWTFYEWILLADHVLLIFLNFY